MPSARAWRRRFTTRLDVAEADDDARVIIITGAGRAFSSGYDIGSVREAGEIDMDTMIAKGSNAAEHVSRWFFNDRKMVKNQIHIFELSKPVIACVHGWCMGGGTWLALTCDMTFASEDATFGQPEVRMISNTSFLWVLMAGYKNALRYSLTGDHVDAKEAHRIGLVNEVFPRQGRHDEGGVQDSRAHFDGLPGDGRHKQVHCDSGP